MNRHRVFHAVITGRAHCSCGESSPFEYDRQQATKWAQAHLADVAQRSREREG